MNMNHSLKNAIWVAALYLIIGLMWIYFSDYAVDILSASPNETKIFQTYKGFFFIFTTSIFLFLLVWYFLRSQTNEYRKRLHLLQQQSYLRQTLQSKENLLKQTNQLAKVGGWSFNPLTLDGEWTDELASIHDLDPDIGINVKQGIEYYAPESKPIIEKAVQEIIENGTPYDLELEIISAKGIRKWVRTIGYPIIENGKVTRVQGAMQDITELKKSKKESEYNMVKFQMLFESSRDALMILSPPLWKFTKINKAAFQLFNIQNDKEFIDTEPWKASPEFQPDGKKSTDKAKEIIDIALKEGSHFFTWRHQRPNGEMFDAEISLTRMNIEGEDPFLHASIRDITERIKYEENIIAAKEQFDSLAHYDPLTGLPNRLSLIEKLEASIFANDVSSFSLFFLDLDGFQEINDSYGHRFGDKLLVEVSLLLQNIFPPETYIVRTGGDEFVVIISQEIQNNLIFDLNHLIDRLNHPFHIDAIDVYTTASIGISHYPDDAKTTEALLQCADAAMYKAKKMGKNRFYFYSTDLIENALYRTSMTSNLKKALENGELKLFYQPQVNPYNEEIIGCEALLRWETVDGFIPPSTFIPICEESGLILDIGKFVLIEGCKTALQWKKSEILFGHIAINVSVRQLVHPDFISTLDTIIHETRCNPAWIELEITESSIIENPEKMISLLGIIKEKGFKISIDDFGTGYSSLSYLKHLPIDKLKIDISFIRNITQEPKNQTIVKTIISLAKGLGMEVLAEGVETAEELEFLRLNGIDSVQGFYYYKPIDPGDLTNLLKSSKY